LLAAADGDDEEKDEFGFDELEGGTDDDFNLDNGFSELSS
jgi:hypothetical protein